MCDNIEIPVVADYTNGKHSQIYTVVYMSCGVIAHIIRYTDLSKALEDALYWKNHTTVWVSDVVIFKGNNIISVLKGRE